MQGHPSAMEAFIARVGEMVVLNAQYHSFADEVRRAVIQLQALEDNAYQDAVAPMAQAQREDAAKPSVEAEAGLMNPENFVDATCLQDDNVDAGNGEEIAILNDDDYAIF